MSPRLFRSFAKDNAGGVLLYTAVTAAVMLGMVGLAIDVGMWYANKRDMQSAADAGAMAAALELARGAPDTKVRERALQSIQLNGYGPGDATINIPPLSGPYTGQPGFVEVVVQQPQPGFVSAMSYEQDMLVAARAVATLAGAPSCIIALNPSDDQTLTVEGRADVDLRCGAQANSTSDTALSQQGAQSSLTATNISSGGGYEGANYYSVDGSATTPNTNMPPAGDPFAYLTPPPAEACLEPAGAPKYYSTGSGTIPRGNYCGGLIVDGGTWVFEPGVYTFDEVGFHIMGNSTVTGADVTFYIMPSVFGIDQGTFGMTAVYFAGTTKVTLAAPTTGQWQGILIYVDQNLSSDVSLGLAGGTDMDLEGAIYAVNQQIFFAGGSEDNSSSWTAVIGDEVHFVGTSYVASGAFTGATLPLALVTPSVVE